METKNTLIVSRLTFYPFCGIRSLKEYQVGIPCWNEALPELYEGSYIALLLQTQIAHCRCFELDSLDWWILDQDFRDLNQMYTSLCWCYRQLYYRYYQNSRSLKHVLFLSFQRWFCLHKFLFVGIDHLHPVALRYLEGTLWLSLQWTSCWLCILVYQF